MSFTAGRVWVFMCGQLGFLMFQAGSLGFDVLGSLWVLSGCGEWMDWFMGICFWCM